MLEQFIWIGKELYDQGLVDSHGGNMSIREGDKIYITRRDAMLGRLTEKDIVEVSLDKEGFSDEQASRELFTHREIYKNSSVKAIVHAHPPYATALSITENKIVPQDSEALYVLKSVPIVRVREAIASKEAVKHLIPIFSGNYVAAMVKGHGSFTTGSSLEEAFRNTSILENSCKITSIVRSSSRPQQQSQQSSSPRHGGRTQDRRSAIPRGIGVMDRSRYSRGGGRR